MTDVPEAALAAGIPPEQIVRQRARAELFERKTQCEFKGIPFEPTPEEQAILDGYEREANENLSAYSRLRKESELQTYRDERKGLEASLDHNPPMLAGGRPDEVGRQRMRERIKWLREEIARLRKDK
jgi:hypothetical protein